MKRWGKIIYSFALLVLILFRYRSDGRNIINPLELSPGRWAWHRQGLVLRWALCSGPTSLPNLHPPSRALLPTPVFFPSPLEKRLLAGIASPTSAKEAEKQDFPGNRGRRWDWQLQGGRDAPCIADGEGGVSVIWGQAWASSTLKRSTMQQRPRHPHVKPHHVPILSPTSGFFHSLNPPFISGSPSSPCLRLYLEVCLRIYSFDCLF